MKHDDNFVTECRKFIVGKTWLKIQLMQGSILTCHHSPRRHFASIAVKRVTEVHAGEVGLAIEMIEIHNAPFYDMECTSSECDDINLKVEWRLPRG